MRLVLYTKVNFTKDRDTVRASSHTWTALTTRETLLKARSKDLVNKSTRTALLTRVNGVKI
jgi:hypothetical protein